MRRPLLALLACALVAGCGVPTDEEPRALDRAAAPFRVFETQTPAQPDGEVQAQLYLVRNGQVQPVQRQVPLPGSAQQVLQQLFDGPTESESASGLSTALPSGLRPQGLEVRDRIAVVSLDGLDEQVRTDQVVAFAQIVATLVARPEIDGVRFRARDRDLPVPRGDGSLTDAPVNRESYAEQLGEPQANAVVPPEPVPGASIVPAEEGLVEPPAPAPTE